MMDLQATVAGGAPARNAYVPGLEGVVAAQTRLSHVDGDAGRLVIAGFLVEELAERATFEEVVYLLWKGSLPQRGELAAFRTALAAGCALAPATLDLLHAAARDGVAPMDSLLMAAASLDLPQPQCEDEGNVERETALLGRLPALVAANWRLRNGLEPLAPRTGLGYAANYLYLLTGELPDPERAHALETYFNTVIDHGLNASTFAARVIISTGSDLVSALVGAIGALKGPLHGGAPAPALDMVFDIGEAARAEAYLRARLAAGERLMGFGHRVYRARDPRAEVLAAAAERFYRRAGDLALYELAQSVEQTAVRLLAEYHPQRKLQTNVEFYTALLLHGIGLPKELFTPTFALSRAAGWIAHCREQQAQNRLIRPQSEYVGARRHWVPLSER